MNKISLIFAIFAIFLCSSGYSHSPVDPIIKESTILVNVSPLEQRDEKYIKFLSSSLKIFVDGSAGSGTICYYDEESNFAYVISCGHIWSGNKNYDPKNTQKAKVITWYHNNIKLIEPKSYTAEVLFYSNDRGYDSSLLRFKPDWKPNYFPIAKEFKGKKGMILNSLGCDGGREVARYEVRYSEDRPPDIITELNSPRPGRSGGGLITDEGELVGICWGTSDISGTGIGYFTPISSIKKVFIKNKHDWLLSISRELEKIKIYDWDNPRKKYDNSFIPMPNIIIF
jgi:hypothetical protein